MDTDKTDKRAATGLLEAKGMLLLDMMFKNFSVTLSRLKVLSA